MLRSSDSRDVVLPCFHIHELSALDFCLLIVCSEVRVDISALTFYQQYVQTISKTSLPV